MRAPGASDDDRGLAVNISCVTSTCPPMEGSASLFEYVYNLDTTFSTFWHFQRKRAHVGFYWRISGRDREAGLYYKKQHSPPTPKTLFLIMWHNSPLSKNCWLFPSCTVQFSPFFPTANINSISTLSILARWQKSPGGLPANRAYQSHHRLGLFSMETAMLPSYSISFLLLQKATILSILKCKTFLRYYYSLQNTSILLFKEMFACTSFHTSYHLPELLSFIKKFTASCLYSQSLIRPFWFKLTLSFLCPRLN